MTGLSPNSRSAADDVVALGRLNSAYADVITRRAFDELRDLMLPGCSVRLDLVSAPERVLEGPDGLTEMLLEAMKRFDHFTFVIRNSVVDIEGDAAMGRMFISEIRHNTASGRWEETHGVYEDDYVRTDGRWWFAERHYRSLARTGSGGVVLGLPDQFREINLVPHADTSGSVEG